MVLDQALEIMRLYAIDRDLDDLSGVEHMVRNYKILSAEQVEALNTFMDETRNG